MNSSSNLARPPDFFIFGCERSGTTLLSALLTEHKEVCVLNDTFVYKIFNDQFGSNWLRLPTKAVAKALLRPSFLAASESSRLPPIGHVISREQLERYLTALATRYSRRQEGNWLGAYVSRLQSGGAMKGETIGDLAATVLGHLVPDDQRTKLLIGEKTPIHSHLSSWLMDAYPRAHGILLLRHPLTNVAAIYKRRHGSRALAESISTYLSYYSCSLKTLLSEFGKRVHLVRYEDLLHSPQGTVDAILHVLGASAGSDVAHFNYYTKQSYVGDHIEPNRDRELLGVLTSEQQHSVLRRCAAGVERYYHSHPYSNL